MSTPRSLWSSKPVVWAAALLIIVGISVIAVWRYQRHQEKAAAALVAQARKAKKKEKEPVTEEAERTPPPPAKKLKVTALSQASREHLAEQTFISSVRELFIWRSQQSQSPDTNRLMLEKFAAITCEDLPWERKSAWHDLLEAWRALNDPVKAEDPQIKEQGQRAAAVLNAMFQAHGDGDIVF